jgi:hypothetical protein
LIESIVLADAAKAQPVRAVDPGLENVNHP